MEIWAVGTYVRALIERAAHVPWINEPNVRCSRVPDLISVDPFDWKSYFLAILAHSCIQNISQVRII